MNAKEQPSEKCPHCGAEMVNCGAPIWDDICPNRECTGQLDEIRLELRAAKASWEVSNRLRDAAPDMFEALKAAEELYQIGLISASNELVERVRDLRRAALSKAQVQS